MGIPVPNDFVKEGTYPAVIAKVWDIDHHVDEWEGKKSVKHKLAIIVEVPDVGTTFTEKVNLPFTWPGKKNSNLWKYAKAAFGSDGAKKLGDFADLEGHGVTVQIEDGQSKSKISNVVPLDGDAPQVMGSYAEPSGLAAWLITQSMTALEAADLKAKWAYEADAAKTFAAPTPGADDEMF